MKTAKELSELAQMACIWEVCAPKPGNVNRNHDFSNTSLEDYLISAIAIGPAFENAARLGVGQIIREATINTRRRVRSNTNLGIVLLLAPLVKACIHASEPKKIREDLAAVLNSLSVEDARFAYSAIRLAQPGGLGKVPESDVGEEPSITLLQAMILAKDRDSIAHEYATNFAITFEIGLPALRQALSRGADFSNAIVHAYLTILSRIPDTLIARKKDAEAAHQVSLQALDVLRKGGIFSLQGQTALSDMDRQLRDPDHVLNPGTTADLTTAAIFLALLE
jgi:triphosphoribosyl-dephospho-CoA synthase